MNEPQLVIYYGLSIGAGLALAVLVYAAIEHFRHPSRIAVFGWLEPSGSDFQQLSIYLDNDSNARTVIHEAGAILADGRRIRATSPGTLRIDDRAMDLPIAVEAGDHTKVCLLPIGRRDVATGLAACYVIRDLQRTVTGPVHGQIEAA